MRSLILYLLTTFAVLAQVQPSNPGFEEGEPGAVPPGWIVPSLITQAGFSVTVATEGCRSGSRKGKDDILLRGLEVVKTR